MRVFLFMAVMTALFYLTGTGVLGLLYGGQVRGLYAGDKFITGFTVVSGIAEAAHLAALFTGRSFSDAVFIFTAGTAALSVLSLGFCLWHIKSGKSIKKNTGKHGGGWSGDELNPLLAGLSLVFMLLVIHQIMTLTSGNGVFTEGDMTVETVESFAVTDGIYSVNPLTGNEYQAGIPLRIKIIGLPTLYGSMCAVFGLESVELVWICIPLLTLFLCYMAYGILARIFWSDRKDHEKRMLFMVIAALIFTVGDYMYGMDGFGLMHSGFRGVVLRNVILLPYVFGLTLRHKWKAAVLCILAEVCLVWTLYGMGTCLAVTLGMYAVYVWKRIKNKGFHDAGEEV